ncbi:MAG: hypothetical protein N3D20_01360 [Candidatus Pacearchaeota archaeon]|nr:hypothetical protein [Candidatus Pacearchaeota archaeon]
MERKQNGRLAYYQDENGLCLVRVLKDFSDKNFERYFLVVEREIYRTGLGRAFEIGREFEMKRRKGDFSGKAGMIYFNHSRYGRACDFLDRVVNKK